MRTHLVTVPSEFHFEESLQRDINLIRSKVQFMADLNEGALYNSLQALIKKDRQLAYTVILRDRCIDELETELDRLCLAFIVRQQPVAGHLRFVYSTIKIIRELERIGDYAESMARQALHLIPIEKLPPFKAFIELADVSIPMLHDAIKAFLEKNDELARKTMVQEEKADHIRNRINGTLFQLRKDEVLPLEALAPLMTIARRLERVADQAKNICEETIYMATGEFAKHPHTSIYYILFVDEDNACVSQMAEAIGEALKIPKFCFKSAGIKTTSVDPMTKDFLSVKGIDISTAQSKSIDQAIASEPIQVIVALSPQVREHLPRKLENLIVLDWSIKNPSRITGQAAQIRKAYEETFSSLTNHIKDLIQAIVGQNTSEKSCTG
jgi:phosphate transport system protein